MLSCSWAQCPDFFGGLALNPTPLLPLMMQQPRLLPPSCVCCHHNFCLLLHLTSVIVDVYVLQNLESECDNLSHFFLSTPSNGQMCRSADCAKQPRTLRDGPELLHYCRMVLNSLPADETLVGVNHRSSQSHNHLR